MDVTIIGLGWLGLSLAHQLSQNKVNITGTVTSTEKAKHLQDSTNFNVFTFNCYDLIEDELAIKLFENKRLVINIAAGRTKLSSSTYFKAISALIDIAVKHQVKQIIFISTTSVYSGYTGIVGHSTPKCPTTESGIAHSRIEDYLLDQYGHMSLVLRLSGLVGPNYDGSFRHPVNTLVKKQQISGPECPVNLVHKQDVIQAIAVLLEQKICGKAYNLCSLEHPQKQPYYTWCAQQLGISSPNFLAQQEQDTFRIVDGKNAIEELGIELVYPSPFDMLPA
ncbi:NAD-dependent epimerase/dehydratase family protein [Glaciecola sp. 1036]|uniref:NAD-dependent epimerase/dehydratase family protein n=1 Tax=Alteromonadaceae TaxID=72275 RepID=UPI003CFF0416